MLNKFISAILMATILSLAGATTSMADPGGLCIGDIGICDRAGDGKGYSKSFRARNGKGNRNGNADKVNRCNAAPDLTTLETDWLMYMREEEKVARDSYLVLGDLWGLVIFENIATSEQRHMDAMKKLLDCYKLEDPVIHEIGAFSEPKLQALFDFLISEGEKTMMDSLYVGALIEETDMKDIQDAIDDTDHTDIISTYESLLCGSRNHLRAFIRQIEVNGGSYTPTVLDADEFWEIAYSQMEQDCGNHFGGKK